MKVLGAVTYMAAVYYDDGDDPTAWFGPSDYFPDAKTAKAWARKALAHESRRDLGSGYWYATIERGRFTDPIGDGREYDYSFEGDHNSDDAYEMVRLP